MASIFRDSLDINHNVSSAAILPAWNCHYNRRSCDKGKPEGEEDEQGETRESSSPPLLSPQRRHPEEITSQFHSNNRTNKHHGVAVTTNNNNNTEGNYYHDYNHFYCYYNFLTFPCNPLQWSHKKRRFLFFIRILLRYLQARDPPTYNRASCLLRHIWRCHVGVAINGLGGGGDEPQQPQERAHREPRDFAPHERRCRRQQQRGTWQYYEPNEEEYQVSQPMEEQEQGDAVGLVQQQHAAAVGHVQQQHAAVVAVRNNNTNNNSHVQHRRQHTHRGVQTTFMVPAVLLEIQRGLQQTVTIEQWNLGRVYMDCFLRKMRQQQYRYHQHHYHHYNRRHRQEQQHQRHHQQLGDAQLQVAAAAGGVARENHHGHNNHYHNPAGVVVNDVDWGAGESRPKPVLISPDGS